MQHTDQWLKLAKDARQAAQDLCVESHYRASVSRAYYAAYSRVTHELVYHAGVIVTSGRDGPSHKKIRPLIESNLPGQNKNKNKERVSELIGRLYALRIDADYKPTMIVEGREAREAISIMKTIFELV